MAVLSLPRLGRCEVHFDQYEVHLELDTPDDNRFQVTSTASGSISAGSDTIVLDYKGDTVDSLSLVLDGVKDKGARWLLSNGHLKIKLESPAARHAFAEVTTTTTATYAEPKGEGLVKYQGQDGTFYSTQFEPAAARAVFPVVDRPDAPARFQFAVQCRSSCQAFSNTTSDQTGSDTTLVEFHTTPSISPHLLAFIAGDVVRSRAIEAGSRHVAIALVSPKSYQQYASRVLKLSKEVVDAFEVQGLVLPNNKVNLVLVPQFRYYGMENPGILFFRAELVSWAANGDHWNDLKQLIAHEFAHQWFGNLLAPSRWRDIWISESFATWATERIMPTAGSQWIDLVDQIRGIGLPVVSNYPQVESSPASIFASSRYGRGARVLQSVFSHDVTLGAALDGLLSGDSRAYLNTEQLLDRLEHSGLSSVDTSVLHQALYTVPPDPVVIDPTSRGRKSTSSAGAEVAPCVDTYVPSFNRYPLRIWTYMNEEAYSRVLRCIDGLSEPERLTLDISIFEATWRGELALSSALGFVEKECATSDSSNLDSVRAEILRFMLQAVPAGERSEVRSGILDRIENQRGTTSGEGRIRTLLLQDESTGLSVASVRAMVASAAAKDAEKLTSHSLAMAQPEGVRWLVGHPGLWPLSKDDAYRFASEAIQREDAPLQGITIEQFRDFLDLNVDPGRYDNLASKFAWACDEFSLGLLLGTDHFQSPGSIEQRDSSARAIHSCLYVRSRAALRPFAIH